MAPPGRLQRSLEETVTGVPGPPVAGATVNRPAAAAPGEKATMRQPARKKPTPTARSTIGTFPRDDRPNPQWRTGAHAVGLRPTGYTPDMAPVQHQASSPASALGPRAEPRHKRSRAFRLGAACVAGAVVVGGFATPASAASKVSKNKAVKAYAPLVYLAPGENDLPMNASDFIKASSLNFHHDKGCSDDVIAPPGKVNAKKLGSGGYSHPTKSSPLCEHTNDVVRTNQNVRPNDDGNDADSEGFFLDLPNKDRGGKGTKAKVYYSFYDEKAIVYWFFYGNDDAPSGDAGDHEGDWENITVILGRDNRADRVVYFRHGKPCSVAYSKKSAYRGHPVAYSADGTHASYPTGGSHDAGFITDTTGKGKQWKTYQNLKSVSKESWYGYGGGWGEVGTDIGSYSTTGPQGPSKYKTGLASGTEAAC